MDGYAEARKIDERINKLIERENGIDRDNAAAWVQFARTLRSGLTVLENVALRRQFAGRATHSIKRGKKSTRRA